MVNHGSLHCRQRSTALLRAAALGIALAVGTIETAAAADPETPADAAADAEESRQHVGISVVARLDTGQTATGAALLKVQVDGHPAGLVEVSEAARRVYRFHSERLGPRSRIEISSLRRDAIDAAAVPPIVIDAVRVDGQAWTRAPKASGPAALPSGRSIAWTAPKRSESSRGNAEPSAVSTVPVVISAAGSPLAGIWPTMQLRIAGATLAQVSVESAVLQDYRLDLPRLSAGQTLDVVFTNDQSNGVEDRNLYVDRVSVDGRIARPSNAGVVYDRGAIDGVDTIAGRSAMLWAGALRFPAALFAGTATPIPPAAAAACAASAFCEAVGLNVKFSQGQPASDLSMLPALGVRWVRDSVRAADIEPAARRYAPFSGEALRRFAYYRDQGIGLVFVMPLNNAPAYPSAPYDAAAYGRRAVEIARMLKAIGVRFVLEIGNEPHNELVAALGGQWQGRPPSPWLNQYVAMVREAVRQVKAYDASVKLLADDDMWVIHYWFLEAGLPADLDGLAVHPYNPGPPELAAVQYDTDWTRPFQVVDPDGSMVSGLRRLQAQARLKMGRTPELWITEKGWPIGSGGSAVSEETLATYLPRFYIAAIAAGARLVQWFSSQDSVDGPMGLLTNEGRRRAPYTAFEVMTRELNQHGRPRQLVGSSNPTRGAQVYAFLGTSTQKLAAWSADTSIRVLRVRAGLQVTATSVTGQSLRVATTPDGASLIPFGGSPVYVTVVSTRAVATGDVEVW